jgi:hypothetical protein
MMMIMIFIGKSGVFYVMVVFVVVVVDDDDDPDDDGGDGDGLYFHRMVRRC